MFSALYRRLRRRAIQSAELLRTGVLPEPINPLNDRTSVPSVHPRGDYPANRLVWLANVPADERDFDGADLDQASSQLTIERHPAGPLLAVTHAFVIGRCRRWTPRDLGWV